VTQPVSIYALAANPAANLFVRRAHGCSSSPFGGSGHTYRTGPTIGPMSPRSPTACVGGWRRWSASWPGGFCHGDFHGWNVHVAADGSPTVFDFDGCGPGWRADDLATFRHSLGLDPAKSASWASFLQGYAERRPVAAADGAAIAPFVALCELWVMGGRVARVPDWGILWLDDRLERGVRFLKRWEAEHLDLPASHAAGDG
jgi:Ser/Thr protein kinase RdoA (MazF antagonist)